MHRSLFACIPPVFALALALSSPAAAQKPGRVDDASHRIFGLAGKKYEGLSGLRVSFTVSRTNSATVSGVFTYAYLGKANLDWTVGKSHLRSVTDGDQFYELSNKTFTQSLSPGMPGLIATLWQRIPGTTGQIMDPLFSGLSPAGQLAASMVLRHATGGGEDIVRGVATGLPKGSSSSLELRFGGNDHLLHRVVETIQNGPRKSITTTTFGAYQINPRIADSLFRYKPGKGYKQYDPEAAEAAASKPAVYVGGRPLPISGKDLNGKPRSLSDYKGKVLLVDFWATWCGPCVAELPNVQRVYRQYHARGFEVLSISLDSDKRTLANFVKARGIPWPQLYSGKSWNDPIAQRYHVQGIPFMMLIGPDGRIAALDPRGPELEAAVLKFMGGWT